MSISVKKCSFMVKSCRWTYEWNKSVTDLLSKLLGYKSEKSYVETRQSQILRIGWYWKAFLPELSKRRVSMMTIIGASVYHGRNQSMIAIRNLTKLCETWKILLMLLQNTTWWGKLPLHLVEQDLLRKVFLWFYIKKGLGVVVMHLDSLPQLLCWWLIWL